MLAALRNVNTDRLDIDEAVSLVTFGRGMISGYKEYGLEAPEWLGDTLELLDREIKDRRRDAISKELKEIDSREAALKTNAEKRAELASKRSRLLKAQASLK